MGEDLVVAFRRVSSLCSQTTAKGGDPKAFGAKDTPPSPSFSKPMSPGSSIGHSPFAWV